MANKFAVLVSGYGRGAIEIIKDYRFGLIKPELSLILSSVSNSKALSFATENGIEIGVIEKHKFKTKMDFENEIISVLSDNEIDYIFLAGWMPIVGSTLLKKYYNKIINIHPSLLPSFKGLSAIDKAMNYGVKITGITTHYVDNTIDGGKIIDQVAIRITDEDIFETIDNKIFKAGTILSIETINKIFI